MHICAPRRDSSRVSTSGLDAVTLGEAILAQSEPRPIRGSHGSSLSRRQSIALAGGLGSSADDSSDWVPPVVSKTPLQLSKLQESIKGNFLFLKLTEEKRQKLLDAFVCRQARDGDHHGGQEGRVT